jgi:hypothetical protein
VLIGAGAWAAWYFNNPWAQGLLAAPAAALGLLFFVVRPGRREIPAVSSMPNAG